MSSRASWALSAIVLFSGCGANDNGGGPYITDSEGPGARANPIVAPMPDVPVISLGIGAACSGAEGCKSGVCLGTAFHPDFELGYCSAFCEPNEDRSCGVQAHCVPARVGICMRSCDVFNSCLPGQRCVSKTCVPDSIILAPGKTDLIRAGDKILQSIAASVDATELAKTVRTLSGTRVPKPLSLSPSEMALFAPTPGEDDAGVAFGAVDPSFRDPDVLLGVDIRSRAVAHPDHDIALAWLISKLEAMNLRVEKQTFAYVRQPLLPPSPDFSDSARMARPPLTTIVNVRAFLPGSQPELPHVLVTAHYDSTARLDDGYVPNASPAPGAGDNATGVGAVLEIARILSTIDRPLRRTVEFVLFDAEEAGWSGSMLDGQTGSRRYVGALPKQGEPFCTLNLDGMAWRTLGVAPMVWLGLDPDHDLASKLGYEAIRDTIPDLGMVTTRANAFFTISDHVSFMDRGMCAAFLYSWPPGAHAGTQYDTIMSVDWELYDNAVMAAGVVVGAWANYKLDPELTEGL